MTKAIPETIHDKKHALQILRAFMRIFRGSSIADLGKSRKSGLSFHPHTMSCSRKRRRRGVDKRVEKEIQFRDTLAPYIVLFDNQPEEGTAN